MYIFIVNPVAGNGRAKRIFSEITSSYLYHQIKSTYFFTKYEGHAEEIIKNIIEDHANVVEVIIVVGGDGTLHEVMNGLATEQIPISFIPGGSGNDFARGCSIKEGPIDILQRIIHQNRSKPYWLGTYKTDRATTRAFVNSIGFGFDAEIAKVVNESFYKNILNTLRLGKISYIIALIQVLFRFKPMTVEIELDGHHQIITDCWMMTVANHPYYGGGMKIIPQATIQPSKFPVLFIRSISKLKILSLFFTVFTGSHVKYNEVEIFETAKIKITANSNDELTFQVDGETSSCKSCLISKQSKPIWVNGTTNEKNEQTYFN